jgi:hypothetical protein
LSCQRLQFVIIKPLRGKFRMLIMFYLWTRLRVSFNAHMSILVAMKVIYRVLTRQLMTGRYFIIARWPKWIGLGDSTVFSWAGCHTHPPTLSTLRLSKPLAPVRLPTSSIPWLPIPPLHLSNPVFLFLAVCWRIKDVSTYDPQAYEPTPFSPWDSLGSCQSAEQGDYKRLIYLYALTYRNPIYG